jgi:hypothetical protein
MEINFKIGGLGLVVLLTIAGGAWYLSHQESTNGGTTAVMANEVPVVMRTPGGLLEVATIKAHERFTRSDTKEFWGIFLGTTVSHIQVPVHYRYHIELAPEWIVLIKGKTCIVVAPPIKPSLPVAFDTTLLETYTDNGWARLNKHENLAALERSMTPELAKRAAAPSYLQLATEPARQTVKEFVTKWLVKEQQWKRDPDYNVKVVFQGEPGIKGDEVK